MNGILSSEGNQSLTLATCQRRSGKNRARPVRYKLDEYENVTLREEREFGRRWGKNGRTRKIDGAQ
jgi:hypothetical protein